mmetsp:Transcript_130216/g.291174  ORF Transcript_130216/g.291174 Transcript_130216/m.291174 type:complete len:842 (-) Transcript_130216:242-2767(-)
MNLGSSGPWAGARSDCSMANSINQHIIDYVKDIAASAPSQNLEHSCRKAAKLFKDMKSPVDHRHCDQLQYIGPFLHQRIAGHDFEGKGSAEGEVLKEQVQAELSEEKIFPERCTVGQRNRLNSFRTGLMAFRGLVAIKDVRRLGCYKENDAACMKIVSHLEATFSSRKRGSGPLNSETPKKPRRCRAAAQPPVKLEGAESARACAEEEASAKAAACQKKWVPPKKGSGRWAILMGLYRAPEPLTKTVLAELTAKRLLSNSPLLEGSGPCHYSPWSGHKDLVERGLLASVKGPKGQLRYFLSEAGVQRAAELDSVDRAAGSCPDAMRERTQLQAAELDSADCAAASCSDAAQEWTQLQDVLEVDLTSDVELEEGADAEAFPDLGRQGEEFTLLMDTRETEETRSQLRLAFEGRPKKELELPGVDFLFGQARGYDFELSQFAVERKTVKDYLETMRDPARGHRQAKVQATLRSNGFRVIVILEGMRELALLEEADRRDLLAHMHSTATEVFTTESLVDTAEVLQALGQRSTPHDGWSLAGLQVLFEIHYAPDEAADCAQALRAVRIPGPLADKVQMPLRELLDPADGLHCLADRLSVQLGITPYKAGQILSSLGHTVDLTALRRRRIRTGSAGEEEGDEPAEDAEVRRVIEVASRSPPKFPKLHKELVKHMRGLGLQLSTVESSETWHIRVRHGSEVIELGLTESAADAAADTRLHWLVVTHARCGALRADAFVRGSRTTLCLSAHQAAQHVRALTERGSCITSPAGRCSAQKGIAGVLALARDQGHGSLPAKVAAKVAEAAAQRGIASLVQLASALREDGNCLQGVPELGLGRVEAMKRLLL